jgi:hypothetical protein
MGYFDGITNSLSVDTGSFTSNLISDILESSLSSSGSGAKFANDVAFGKNYVNLAMRIRYAQGWQWTVEVDGLSGFEMFAKDITYGFGNIEHDTKVIGSVEFNKPTHATAGTITLTVMDTEDGKIHSWFQARKARVTNGDGTVNLPPEYLLGIRIYRVTQEGAKQLEQEVKVFPTQLGEITRSRDQVTEFLSYPLTFVKHTSAGSAVTGVLGAVAGTVTGSVTGAASDAIASAQVIKF